MTNRDYLFSLSNEELAEYLVTNKIIYESCDEYDSFGEEVYLSPASHYYYITVEDAIKETAEWLGSRLEKAF